MSTIKKIIYFLFPFCLFAFDLWLKALALKANSFDFKLIKFGLAKNYGLFFWPINQKLLIIGSILLLVFLAFLLFKIKSAGSLIFLSLFLVSLGGVSNLLDRVIYGFVVDYAWVFILPFSWFNLADVMILSGLLLSLHFLLKQEPLLKPKQPTENK